MMNDLPEGQTQNAETPNGAASELSAGLGLLTLGCPFCGSLPKSSGRPSTLGEKEVGREFFHFIACYCGGYSATAHMTGYGATADAAELAATTKWNKRPNVELTGAAPTEGETKP